MDKREGWWVVFGAFCTLSITAGVGFYVMPVMIEPIMAETGWSLTRVSSGVTVWGLSAALLSPLLGMLIDRYGARRMMIFGNLFCFAATIALSRVTTVPQFYIVMALLPIGAMCNTFIPVGIVVAHWFVKRRGIATGMAMLGLGIGGAVTPLLTNALLDSYTWRETYSLLAFGFLIALVPTFVFVRNPDPDEEAAYAEQVHEDVDPSHDLTLGKAIRTRSFWSLGLGDMLTGTIFSLLTLQLVVFLTVDLGDRDTATTVLSVFLLLLAGGTLVFGPLADFLPMHRVLVFCYFLPAVALLFLTLGGPAWMAFSFAILAGLAGGGRVALFPLALVNSFGETHMAAIWGLSNSLFMLGNALGPLVGGYVYEQTESTRAVYILCVVILLVSAGLIALVRVERPQPESKDALAG